MTAPRILALALVFAGCSGDRRNGEFPDSAPAQQPAMDTPQPAPDTPPGGNVDSVALGSTRITVERAVINGVLWGSPTEQVRGTMGAPRAVRTEWDAALEDSAEVMEFPGMTVRAVEDRVIAVRCTGTTCITADAVRVGATRDEVIRVYGQGMNATATRLTYPYTTDNSCALRFTLEGGKVSAMEMSCHKP